MLVLCGTNRPEANSRKVAKRVFQLLEAKLVDNTCVTPKYLDLENLRPDIFDVAAYGEKPQWFAKEFQEPIIAAQGMIVITPEYNGSFPGVLKYFIDMLKFPESLVGVPVAFIGCAAGMFGALRSVEQLEIIFYRKVHIYGERLFIPQIGDALQDDGSLGEYEERLGKLVSGFVEFVIKYRELS